VPIVVGPPSSRPSAVRGPRDRATRRGSTDIPDISWFRPDSSEMSDDDWDSGFGKSVAVYLNGQGIPDCDMRGERVTDD
jgi:isoamylase